MLEEDKGNKLNFSSDLFFNGKLKIFQSKDFFKSGSDAVFLSAFVDLKRGTILDVGCGTGVVSLCLAYRTPQLKIYGLDIQEKLIELCILSAQENGLSTKCTFLTGNILKTEFPPQSLDAVVTNPPYFDNSSPSPKAAVSLAKAESVPIDNWIHACTKLLKPRGVFYCIYPAAHIEKILKNLDQFGDITIFPLWPRKGQDAKRVLIKAKRLTKGPTIFSKGLVLHKDSQNTYTKEAEQILKDGLPLAY